MQNKEAPITVPGVIGAVVTGLGGLVRKAQEREAARDAEFKEIAVGFTHAVGAFVNGVITGENHVIKIDSSRPDAHEIAGVHVGSAVEPNSANPKS